MKMKDFLQNTWKHRAHVVMALPAFLILLFFSYIPMGDCEKKSVNKILL